MNTQEIMERAARVLVPTYSRYPVAIVRGEGATVWDADGKEYLDLAAGLGTSNLGHCHPRVVEAIAHQASRLLHVSNLYHIEEQVRLAEALVERSFAERAFFCNSGAEANEAAIKLARKAGRDRFGPGRHEILVMENSFHGRTMATLSATGQAKVREDFEPLLEGFRFVPFNDLQALEAAVTERTCAVLVEPIQGEGGVIVPDEGYLPGLRRLCDARDLLLVYDEIQTGFGRTGHLFAYEAFGAPPHIITVAKSLGGGVPIGAMLTTDDLAQHLGPGTHASTFGGNPLVCAAALAALEALEVEQLMANARKVGAYFRQRLEELQARHQAVREVRGLGLMIGVELDRDARPFLLKALERGVIISCPKETVWRFLPPLVITEADVDRAVGVLDELLVEDGT
ncbi:MAG: acetylornithine transaminase [Nitrospinae bacterium]|nr:acetylornithine transaminase [Nitrospinota bacterium]